MTPWEVLGCEPTRDQRAIKKAYASRLKTVHPEDDPAGFQLLHQAYESALAWAAFHAQQAPSIPEPTPAPANEIAPVPGRVEDLIERVRLLHADETKRREVGAWRQILDDDALWSLDTRAQFAAYLFSCLLESWRDFPPTVLVMFEEEFRYREDGLKLHRWFGPPAAVDALLSALHRAPPRTFSLPQRDMRKFKFHSMESYQGDSERGDWSGLPGLLARMVPILLIVTSGLFRSPQVPSASPGSPGRRPTSIESLESAARRGDGNSAGELAHRLLTGEGDAETQFRLGVMYLRGAGVTRNDPLAYKLLLKAAQSDHAEAQAWVGYTHENGRGVPPSPLAAAQWYRKAAGKEIRFAQLRLGRLLAAGPQGLHDPEGAFFWLSLASLDEEIAAEAEPLLERLRGTLSPDRLAWLEERVETWRSDPSTRRPR